MEQQMTYARFEDNQVVEYPFYMIRLRRLFPDTSFPLQFTDAAYNPFGVYEVVPSTQPEVDHTKNVIEADPVIVEGQAVQQWLVVDASEDEIADRIEQLKKQATQKINRLLRECDWTQLADSPLSEQKKIEWARYRSRLLDLPYNLKFPLADIWPVPPSK